MLLLLRNLSNIVTVIRNELALAVDTTNAGRSNIKNTKNLIPSSMSMAVRRKSLLRKLRSATISERKMTKRMKVTKICPSTSSVAVKTKDLQSRIKLYRSENLLVSKILKKAVLLNTLKESAQDLILAKGRAKQEKLEEQDHHHPQTAEEDRDPQAAGHLVRLIKATEDRTQVREAAKDHAQARGPAETRKQVLEPGEDHDLGLEIANDANRQKETVQGAALVQTQDSEVAIKEAPIPNNNLIILICIKSSDA